MNSTKLKQSDASALDLPAETFVEVFDVKPSPEINCDFIDMELCDFNLATYIRRNWDENLRAIAPYYVNFSSFVNC